MGSGRTLGTLLVVLAASACSASSAPSGFEEAGGAGPASGAGSSGAGGALGLGGGQGAGGGILDDEPPCDPGDPGVDRDGDGFTPATGDCNDCTAQMNPGAFDYPGNGVDEDCNGAADDEPAGCDAGLPADASDPVNAARAIDLCRMQAGASWGLVGAQWVHPDGKTVGLGDGFGCGPPGGPPNADSRGILTKFGAVVKPRQGQAMLAMSSGVAREGEQPAPVGSSPSGGQMCTESFTPPGFPKDSPACSVQTATDKYAYDPIGLELSIRAPTNAKSIAFDFDFYTFEWPEYVCTQYNDFFVALLTSGAPSTPSDKNVSFDAQGNPVSVNNAFVEVCPGPTTAGGKSFACSLGTAELAGTGFDSPLHSGPHAATSWLVTQADVVPGETLSIRFAIWDMGDEILDSTALLDHLRFEVAPGANGPVTEPVPK